MTALHTYITVAEATSLITKLLPSSDARRVRFLALSDDDKLVCLVQATGDIDVQHWQGCRAVPGQEGEWPRWWSVHRPGVYVDPDPDPPSVQAAGIDSIPARLRAATCVQAAHYAERAAGLNATRHLEDAANRGLVSHSGGGQSETIDARLAARTWSRLCVEAQRYMQKYRRAAFEIA